MGVINLLSDEVSQLISAGEVVERPLSVVKELVENAIDANGDRIEIKIINGGKTYISVRDNGYGMDKEDLEKCLKKYATSKIKKKEDLFNILTLGFRGEALYSISAVSKINIYTRHFNDSMGWKLSAVGGEIKDLREYYIEKGTLIEVEDLFFNIPARRKFLKSDGWERQLIIKFIEEMSLIYFDKTFILNSQGKDLIVLNAVSDVPKRIYNLFPTLIGKILYHKEEEGKLICNLYISSTNLNIPEFYVVAVNGRVVKERVINKVIKDVFESQNKKPSFLFLDFHLPPYEIDVNVHPTKREIKFKNNEQIYAFLRKSFENTLRSNLKPVIKEKDNYYDKSNNNFFVRETLSDYKSDDRKNYLFEEESDKGLDQIKILGVFANCFILVEREKELIIIDQHALHERLIFNKLLNLSSNNNSMKKLVLPYIFNVPESLKSYLDEQRSEFEKLGFIFEEIGPKTYALTDIPAFLDYDSAVYAFSELIKDQDLKRNKKDLSRERVAMYACKKAVKKDDILDFEEIKKVVKDFLDNKIEEYCPHGRVFITKMTFDELEKMFGRKK